MKKFSFSVVLLFVLSLAYSSYASIIGWDYLNGFENITVNDGITNSTDNSSWVIPLSQGMEDNETERTTTWPYNTVRDQIWDLEGMFFNGTELVIVGGYNFANAPDNDYMGDIFVGDYSTQTPIFAFDFNAETNLSENGDLSLVSLDSNSTYKEPWFVHESGQWRVDTYASVISTGSYSTGSIIGGTSLFNGNGHYFLSVTLDDNDLWNGLLLQNFYATMACGNDQIVGQAAPVPEPATLLLLGTGLIGLAGASRKKFKK